MNDHSKVISYINGELIPSLIQKRSLTIDGIPGDDCARLESVETKPLQADGTFMLSTLFKVKVALKADQSAHGKREIQLIVKVTPSFTEEMYASCQFDTLFENETIAYTEIIPTLGKTHLYPRYYYSHRKPLEAVMILSDFSVDGWKMAPMVVNLPLEYCLLAVQELGRFHGECYALKEKKRDLFDSIVAKFKESRYSTDLSNMSWSISIKTSAKRAMKAVRESQYKDMIPDEYLKKFSFAIEDPWDVQKRCVVPQEPLAVICHGDYLRNNLAFKFDDAENNDRPSHVMMFDFQTLRYASPMIDFAVFIANSTGCDVRREHFETIFKSYHNELVRTLCSIIGANPDDLPQHYSYEAFQREFARFFIFGFVIAMSFLAILFEPVENVYEMETLSKEEVIADTMTRGGAALDRELATMVYEMYQMHKKFGMDPE